MNIKDIDNAVVINLRKRPNRYQDFINQSALNRLPFQIQRYEGFDGERFGAPDWYIPGAGAFGCMMSHLDILRHAIENENQFLWVMEDDCRFNDNFVDNLESCLSELPENFDIFYLGGEYLYIDDLPPIRVSSHLAKPLGVNLTTSYILSKKAMKCAWDYLINFDRWKNKDRSYLNCWQHIDRSLAEWERNNCVKVYTANPWLCYQEAGWSDVTNITWNKREFSMDAIQDKLKICDGVKLFGAKTEVGSAGLGGQYGFEPGECKPPFSGGTLSLHANSVGIIDIDKEKYVYAYIDSPEDARSDIHVIIDGRDYGTIRKSFEFSEPVRLDSGHHVLEFRANNETNYAHSVWVFTEEPTQPFSESVIEIIVNTLCPRHCPACNQEDMMKAYKGYEFTPENASRLVASLEKHNIKTHIVCSGGEPRYWSQMEDVLKILRTSKNILSITITTSQDERDYIEKIKTLFDHVYFSKRASMSWSTQSPPEWMKSDKISIWGQSAHALWPKSRNDKTTKCCCNVIGVRAAIFGSDVIPCTCAIQLHLLGRWPDMERVSFDDYFSGRHTFGKIGTYEACRWCVNNIPNRESAEWVTT